MNGRRGRNLMRGRAGVGPSGSAGLHRRFVGALLPTGRSQYDPPAVVDKPWNTVTVQLGGTKDQTVTPKDLVPVMLKQLGMVSSQTVEIRVSKVRVWALSVERPIRVSFFGFSNDTAGGALAVQEDWGSPNKLPHVGYTYPTSVQLYAYAGTSDSFMFRVDVGSLSSASTSPWLAYVDVLWRSDVYNPISESVRWQCQLAARGSAWSVLDAPTGET